MYGLYARTWVCYGCAQCAGSIAVRHAFFIPRQLIDYEYFKPVKASEEFVELAQAYRQEMDFAFYAVNFGYSKADYIALTDTEKAFIRKAYENHTVTWTTLMRDVVINAICNALRKKGKSFRPLWKNTNKKDDKATAAGMFKAIMEIEKHEKGWIKRIYKANGMNKPIRLKK